LDDQVKLRGFRIELGEIEATLCRHSSIRQAAVVTRGTNGETQLIGYLLADAEVPAGELRAYVTASLPDYMAPSAYVYVNAWPLSPSGKLDRSALPAPTAAAVKADTYVAPRNDTEADLAAMWQELLSVPRVGMSDNFFELGGHSLLLTQVAARIRAAYYVDIPLQVLFDAATVEQMSMAILEAKVEHEDPDEIAELLERIQRLSPDEVQAMLESNAE
jgi:hypothetical protein